MDKTTKKLNFVQEKLGKLLKTNGKIFNYYRYGTNMHYPYSFRYSDHHDILSYLHMISHLLIFIGSIIHIIYHLMNNKIIEVSYLN